LTAGGIAAGPVASTVVTRLMSKLLFGVSAGDPLTFTVVPVLLGIVGVAASLVPAMRAGSHGGTPEPRRHRGQRIRQAHGDEAARCAIDPASGEPKYFGPAFATTTAHRYRICEKRDRWNDTPYWAMQMPAIIVPDRSGIFNINFLNLLETFALDPGEIAVPGYRPTLKLRTTGK
jgi:hypothetical protein